MKKVAVCVFTWAAIAAVCKAASPTTLPESLLACARFQDPMERVHCYDAQIAALHPPASVPSVSAPSAQSASPAKFGEEQLPNKTRSAPAQEEAMLSNITSIRTVGQKIYLIALANGQVWRQEGSQLPALFKVGTEARIERGAFGSYHLSIAAFGAKDWVLVTRTR